VGSQPKHQKEGDGTTSYCPSSPNHLSNDHTLKVLFGHNHKIRRRLAADMQFKSSRMRISYNTLTSDPQYSKPPTASSGEEKSVRGHVIIECPCAEIHYRPNGSEWNW